MKNSGLNMQVFNNFPELKYAISTKADGSMKNDGKYNFDNMKRFFLKRKIQTENTVLMNQVHGNKIIYVDNIQEKKIYDCDGLITDKKNVFLCVVTADCIPFLFYDSKKKLIGVVHAGYRGLLTCIIRNMLGKFKKLGSNLNDLNVLMGPSIGVCCYDVPLERAKKFEDIFTDYKNFFVQEKGKTYLNIKTVALQDLVLRGVGINHIQDLSICTKCNLNKYYSYRGESKKSYGEFLSFIGIE